MIIHRPHRGGLDEAMAEAREFNSLKECLLTLIKEFNQEYLFEITLDDIVITPYGKGDERIGWHDLFMICCVPYDRVNDKDGYLKYYGDKYNHPLQLFGFISTDYENKTN